LKTTLKLTILGLAGYGGYTLWNQYFSHFGARLETNDRNEPGPSGRQIHGRSELTVAERAVGSDDPEAQATAILTDSDERSRLPRTADGVEHRRSEDTVEP
jgi:hypothetical protein